MNLKNIISKEIFPGLKGKIIHGDKISWAFWDVEKGTIVPEHKHFNEQIMNVVKGKFEFTLDGKTLIYGPGSVVVIPPNIFHSGKALTKCKIMDVFSPVREEYK